MCEEATGKQNCLNQTGVWTVGQKSAKQKISLLIDRKLRTVAMLLLSMDLSCTL